jgi:hypothetical protein
MCGAFPERGDDTMGKHHEKIDLPVSAVRCYLEPAGFRDRPVAPGAHFDAMLGEFILPYDTVRAAANPDTLLLDFLSTTYAAAAGAGSWDRAALECPIGVPAQVRPL